MKNFSNYVSWLKQQSVTQMTSVLSSALSRANSALQLMRNIPTQYNNVFQSVFLYHYDSNGQFVDDTTADMEAIANNVISDASASLEGYLDYFHDTKSGVTVDGNVTTEDVYANINAGPIHITVDHATGVFVDATIDPVQVTIDPPGGNGASNVLSYMVDTKNLGNGFSVAITAACHATATQTGQSTFKRWVADVTYLLELYQGNTIVANLSQTASQSTPSSDGNYPLTLTIDGAFQPGAGTKPTGSPVAFYVYTNGVLIKSIQLGPNAAIPVILGSVSAQANNKTTNVNIVDGVDIVEKILEFIPSIEEAIQYLP